MIDVSDLKFMFKTHYVGYSHRVSLSTLCDYFKQKDGRDLRRAFHELRKQGFLIAANSRSKGYWYTTENMIKYSPREFDEVDLMVKENNSRIGRLRESNQPFDYALHPEKNPKKKEADQIKLPFKNEAQAVTY